MPHQQTNQLDFITQSGSNHQSNLPPTQPTSNISDLNNTTTTIVNCNSSSSHQQAATSPSTPTCQILVSPNSYEYNNLYGCQSILSSKKKSCKTKAEYFRVLYCMYSGCEGPARKRIDVLLENKNSTVTLRSIKTMKKEAVGELLRRFSYLMLKEKGVLGFDRKIFRPANKSLEEIGTLFKSSFFCLPTGEKLYLEFEMEAYLSHYEKELQIRLDELQQLGSEISKSDLRKMRLWEAIFLDSKYMRDKLVTLKHTMSREQIDARNSITGPLSLFQLAAEKYNDSNWVATSRIMPDLNEKFRTPISLVLMPGEEEMTEMSVKSAYTDAKGKLNVAISNWKRSGNGKGNLNPKVKGLGYDLFVEDDSDIMYVDDDRYNFVNQLHIAYFWSLSEITGLTQHISQNCSSLKMGIHDSDTTGNIPQYPEKFWEEHQLQLVSPIMRRNKKLRYRPKPSLPW